MRERGSNTAHPPKKGGGGLPIGACLADFVAFRSIRSRFDVDSVAIRSRKADFILPIGAFRSIGAFRCRFGRDSMPEDKTQKSPIPYSRESGCLASLCVARFYASNSSSLKYACKRSKRSANSGASILHRDDNG